jgi:hypothetical protein
VAAGVGDAGGGVGHGWRTAGAVRRMGSWRRPIQGCGMQDTPSLDRLGSSKAEQKIAGIARSHR